MLAAAPEQTMALNCFLSPTVLVIATVKTTHESPNPISLHEDQAQECQVHA